MDDLRALKIAVTGGSIGGLAAGIALRGIGAEVDVFEREPGPLRTGGAGIVVQPDLLDLLAHHGAPSLPMTGCSQRRYLTPGGDAARTALARQQFTSWEAIYRTMRAVFPDARYHLDTKVTGYEKRARGVAVEIANHATIEADLLVAATAEPFIQKITDIAVERTVFERVMLLGDAAFLVRPHTAAAAAKACFDAARLAAALVDAGNDIDAALAAAERAQLRYGRRLVEQGIALGSDWPARRA